ncbi:capsid protein [Farfantepenaeus duorarum circovirus]|uniref:capsid protein n=1 Tax=Farfantepenaeus duorarum circovirus TaxID=1380894 RepID=UPI0003874FE9|nr:capsid protein [Farfantepenaeus duorarum circovirus]AGS47836.1 capsid protein [Farfantepenaeus duorarum circovirus]
MNLMLNRPRLPDSSQTKGPYGYAVWANLYKTVRTRGVKIELWSRNRSAQPTGSGATFVGFQGSEDPIPVSDTDHMEHLLARRNVIVKSNGVPAAGKNGSTYIKAYRKLTNIEGHQIERDSDYWADTQQGDPAKFVKAYVGVTSAGNVDTDTSFDLTVRLTFYVDFWGIRDVPSNTLVDFAA